MRLFQRFMYALICLMFSVVVVAAMTALIESMTGLNILAVSGHWFERLMSAAWLLGIFSFACWVIALPFALSLTEAWVAGHGRTFVVGGTVLGPISLSLGICALGFYYSHKIAFGPYPRVLLIYSLVMACLTSVAYSLCMRFEYRRMQQRAA